MNENIESVKKYNLWFGNTIDCSFPRPLYTESVASYLGSKVVKVLTVVILNSCISSLLM
nr:hypothetical protein [uncultured Prevotella sp.]